MVPPLFPHNPIPSPTSSHPPEYLHQNCYLPGIRVITAKRPWWIWAIGNLEIVKSILYSVLAVYHIVYYPPGPADIIWVGYFLGVLGILTGFFQGVGLRSGLKSDDDSETLWYCKVWVACQLVFVLVGVLSIIIITVMLIKQLGDTVLISMVFAASAYPIFSFVVVYRFVEKLEQDQRPAFPN